jgi:hypothetical protein
MGIPPRGRGGQTRRLHNCNMLFGAALLRR